MAMVNPMMNAMQVKDSRWLTLEVCREFTRNKCTRSEVECKFAHPPPHVEVQNGRVTCCFDSIKVSVSYLRRLSLSEETFYHPRMWTADIFNDVCVSVCQVSVSDQPINFEPRASFSVQH